MIVTISDLEEQLSFTDDMGGVDGTLLLGKAEAAQDLIERRLGFQIEARFGGTGQPPVPPALREAVLQLVAWWYENRETAGEGAREVPWGVATIIEDFRDWSF